MPRKRRRLPDKRVAGRRGVATLAQPNDQSGALSPRHRSPFSSDETSGGAGQTWRLLIERPGPIAAEFLKLQVTGDVGYLDFPVDADRKARSWQRGIARDTVRMLAYAGIAFKWRPVP